MVVYKCLLLIVGFAVALPSLSQFGQGRLSLVAISFYALSLLFGPCRLSEFTLAGPQQVFTGFTVRFLSPAQSEELVIFLTPTPKEHGLATLLIPISLYENSED